MIIWHCIYTGIGGGPENYSRHTATLRNEMDRNDNREFVLIIKSKVILIQTSKVFFQAVCKAEDTGTTGVYNATSAYLRLSFTESIISTNHSQH